MIKLSVLFFLCLSLQATIVKAETLKIGISVPLSGSGSTYGEDVKNVLLFANDRLAGGSYQLIIEDDQCLPGAAVAIAHKFVNADKVDYVLGLPCSGALLSAASIYERSRKIVISSLAAAPSISDAGEYIFRTRPSDKGVAKALVPYLATKQHKNLGTLTEQTDFALSTTDAVINEAQKQSIRIAQEDFLPGTTDFRSLLQRLRANKVDSLFVCTQSEQPFANILQAKKEINWDVPVYSSVMAGSRTFIEITGSLSNGIVFATLPSSLDLVDTEGKKLYQEFVERFGEPHGMDFIFLLTWESFRALHLAIQSGLPVQEFLLKTTISGLSGTYTFDKNGDLQGISHVLKTIHGGKIVPLNQR